jgi:hypothetical protein
MDRLLGPPALGEVRVLVRVFLLWAAVRKGGFVVGDDRLTQSSFTLVRSLNISKCINEANSFVNVCVTDTYLPSLVGQV